MRRVPHADVVQVLRCEIDQRPIRAPGIDDLARRLVGTSRGAASLDLVFPASARDMVEAFVAAERRCCPGIGWQVEAGSDVVNLRIAADSVALDVMSKMFGNIDSTR